ncbi:MAG: hypothetical protein ABIT36_05380 [Steroidobacteraceae bacterium]
MSAVSSAMTTVYRSGAVTPVIDLRNGEGGRAIAFGFSSTTSRALAEVLEIRPIMLE